MDWRTFCSTGTYNSHTRTGCSCTYRRQEERQEHGHRLYGRDSYGEERREEEYCRSKVPLERYRDRQRGIRTVTESERIEKTDESGDFTATLTVTDKDGNLVSSTDASQETKDGVVTEQITNYSAATGLLITDATITNPDKTSLVSNAVTDPSGTQKTVVEERDATGATASLTNSTFDKDNKGSATTCDLVGGEAALAGFITTDEAVVIPDTVTDLDGKTYPVTTLQSESIPTAADVTVGDNVTKIETGAFANSGCTTLTFTGDLSKDMFEKNALAGCGKVASKLVASNGKKGGKGLKIYVNGKKSKKVMKKSLKKAGVPKAKIKVAK